MESKVPFIKHVDDINNIQLSQDYFIGFGIVDNAAYLSFVIGWVIVQFKANSVGIVIRRKYGNNNWTDWTPLQ